MLSALVFNFIGIEMSLLFKISWCLGLGEEINFKCFLHFPWAFESDKGQNTILYDAIKTAVGRMNRYLVSLTNQLDHNITICTRCEMDNI